MSNETPKPSLAKTKSALRLRAGLIAAAVVAVLLPFVFQSRPGTTMRYGGTSYALEIVSSQAAREKGLGGRKSLAAGHGMLFVFDKPGVQCFWMKDMRFSIDMVWLNSQKQVTYVAADVSPDTYPHSYCGDASTRYVVELQAGEASRTGLKPGVRTSF